MKTRQSRRQTAKVSHSRWVAYATAGAATALAGSNSAEAAIHYSGLVNEVFPPHARIRSRRFSWISPVITLGFDIIVTDALRAGFRIAGIASAGCQGIHVR